MMAAVEIAVILRLGSIHWIVLLCRSSMRVRVRIMKVGAIMRTGIMVIPKEI